MSHTPGPWAATPAKHPTSDTIGVKAGGKWVALVHPLNGIERSPEVEPNARLIAAAPVLLAALERIAAGDPAHSQFATLAISEARAAIAQARGKV